MAARLGPQGLLRCGDGHREEPLGSLWDRSRVRVHDGTGRSSHEVPRIPHSHGCRSSPVKKRGGSLLPPVLTAIETKKEIRVSAEIILHNAKIATNKAPSFVEAIGISDGKVTATGGNEEILRLRGPATRVIDGQRRTVIPGLNDSHMHPIRGGLNYNLELRWDGVPSLADPLRMLKEHAPRPPAPPWAPVIGGLDALHFRGP